MMWMWDHAEPITPAEYEFWMSRPLPFGWAIIRGIIYLTPDNSSGSYLLMQRAIPPNPIGGCYAG